MQPTRTVADVGEFGLIEIIKEMIPWTDDTPVLGIGDDTAAWRPTPGALTLATCDVQVQGRHFDLGRINPYQLGVRSAAINLSDIASMGGQPRYALVSLVLPKDTLVTWVMELYRGLKDEMGNLGAAIVGGNLSATSGPLIVDIALWGEVAPEHLVRRSGGSPGDTVVVTGALGAASTGLMALRKGLEVTRPDVARAVAAHLTPVPRVREGAVIGSSGMATAMIDISDGLAGDLGHICAASGTGARIVAARLPVKEEVRQLAAEMGADTLALALHGGEDYELAFTCPPSDVDRIIYLIEQRTGTSAAEVGVLTLGTGLVLVGTSGQEQPLIPRGWDHFLEDNPLSARR